MSLSDGYINALMRANQAAEEADPKEASNVFHKTLREGYDAVQKARFGEEAEETRNG